MLILDDALHAWQLGDPAVLEKSSQVEFFSKPGVLSGFPESNQELLTLSVNRTLHSIQLNNGTMTHLSYPQEGHPEILTLSPIKPLLAYTRSYTQVEIWQVSEESPLKTLEMPDVIITSLVFSSDGMQIACGTESGSIYFWGIEAGNLEHIINLPETPQSLLFSADGNGFFARSTNTIFQYNLENGNQERSFTGYGMAVSNDGTYLAVAADVNENPRIEIHLVEDGSLVSQIPRFSSSMAFSPDGSVLVNIWGDLTIWRTSDGALLKSLEIDAQGKAMFSPDGRLLVLNAWDGAVSIWGIP
jgi:WD40 repeat protein